MTIAQAREIIGKPAEDMTDEYIAGIMARLSVLVEIAIEVAENEAAPLRKAS